jgi:hypothetical protein
MLTMKDQRLLINLSEEEKALLDQTAKYEQKSRSAVVREALALYHSRAVADPKRFDELLGKVKGTWRGEEPLAYQRRMRSEWDREE